jgi:hypothetical protein
VEVLEELVALLEQCSEARWCSRIREDLRFLKNQDAFGAERFLSYRGGMGSLNDLVLCQLNGHTIEKSREGDVNIRFAALRVTLGNSHVPPCKAPSNIVEAIRSSVGYAGHGIQCRP